MATHHDAAAPPDDEDQWRRLGQAIERERVRRGWTADEAAQHADVSSKTWQRIEDGKPIRNLTLFKLDDLFGLPRGTIYDAWKRGGPDIQHLFDKPPNRADTRSVTFDDTSWDQRLDRIRDHIAGSKESLFELIIVAINQLDPDELDHVRRVVDAAAEMRQIEKEIGVPLGTVLYAPNSSAYSSPPLTIGNPDGGNLGFSQLIRRVADQIEALEAKGRDPNGKH